MSFHVRLNKEIRAILLSLPRAHQKKVGKLIDRLSENPYPSRIKLIDISSMNFDIKKCKGHQTRFRVRIGEYRLIYQIDEASSMVLILKLDTRGDIY
jgi:mRNA interferase RelE/StbE